MAFNGKADILAQHLLHQAGIMTIDTETYTLLQEGITNLLPLKASNPFLRATSAS